MHREGKKWYLQVMFTIEYEAYETTNQYGVLGLDYNDGFMEMSETDEKGNLIGLYHYKLWYHGTGTKAKTEIEQVVSRIVTMAKAKGKSIVIEQLDFKKTKAKQTKGNSQKGKERILECELAFPSPGDLPNPGIKPGWITCIAGRFLTV